MLGVGENLEIWDAKRLGGTRKLSGLKMNETSSNWRGIIYTNQFF